MAARKRANSEGGSVGHQDGTGVAVTHLRAATARTNGMGANEDARSDARYEAAFATVDRDDFAAGPQRPPSAAALERTLRLLGARSGDRVLEIGTGSGYPAAVLSEIVGRHGDVVTTEADVDVASQARERLIASGRESRYGAGLINVTVLRREPSDVPAPPQLWDRVLLSAPVPLGRVPYAAVAGTRPGGVLVAQPSTEFATGPLVRFDVGSDGVATGTADPSSMERTIPRPTAPSRLDAMLGEVDVSHTTIDVANLVRHPGWRYAVAVAVPSCRYQDTVIVEDRPGLVLTDPMTSSWAHIEHGDGSDNYTVRQTGPRLLADEVLAAIRWYADRGAPPLESWTWEVSPDRQCVTIPG
ncbi:MAG: protein-L-isoaspartate(D-aspartate) O-methyltransferase [Actinophytocola sp.]|nr:protein-L-isoaspartate(D-aspartate) O-methyltransferase [Actinophytocola sp.]